MGLIKTEEEIELLRESNLLVSGTHAELVKWLQPGISSLKLDSIAEEFIRDNNAIPGFLNYDGFPNTLCISINSAVVHGIPSDYELKEGDIVSIDCGVLKNGYYGDSAYTYPIGEVNQETIKLLTTTKESLYVGIQNAVEGKRIGDIGNSIQNYVQKRGYSVVRELAGHGVGKHLHEKPEVPNYGRRGHGVKLFSNMVIAIEPMINLGKRNIVQEKDGWTFKTKDNKPSAHFEHTVVVGKEKADILSDFRIIEEEITKNSWIYGKATIN